MGIDTVLIKNTNPLITETKNLQNTGFRMLHQKQNTAFARDTFTFASDYSLCPDFLNSLLKIRDTGEIKNRILKSIGYTKPQLLEIRNKNIQCFNMGIDPVEGVLYIGNKSSGKELISLLRHELDHFDKLAKLVKYFGYDRYMKVLGKNDRQADCKNRNFWETMSRDADITNFDPQKYLDALINFNWNPCGTDVSSDYELYENINKYYTNELEKSACLVQKKVMRGYGAETAGLYDVYAVEFGRIKELLKPYNNKEEIFDTMLAYSKVLTARKNNLALTPAKKISAPVTKEELEKISDTAFNVPEYIEILRRIQNWLKDYL